jgi:hypothetical protein
MPSKKKNKNKPKEGWVVELKEAEREVKTANLAPHPDQYLRVARAARKLRIWEKSKTAAEKGLSIDPHGPLRAQFVECQKQADKELSIPSKVDCDTFLKAAMSEGAGLDISPTTHELFSNLNLLQFATLTGDVRLLEDLVAYGLALDYPVLHFSSNDCHFPHAEPAPKCSTALVLCCASLLAMRHGAIRDFVGPKLADNKKQDERISRTVECAILLVKLGADFHRKFILDPPSEGCGPLLSWYRRTRLDGKTAQQMAQMAQHPELVKAMEELQSKEKRIALVYCRCGSRLPWKECHAGNSVGESAIYKEKGGRLVWRYSPFAPCLCRHTKKAYYKCCWKESSQPSYMDDYDGKKIFTFNPIMTDGIRLDPRGVAKMDPRIWVNTTERLEGERFRWSSLHWGLSKAKLLDRVKRLNIALEKYCDEEEMTGSYRESVFEKNCATPYALCGNASCTNIETKVKEFSKCSNCKAIAYCSSECQRKGWKVHKESCLAT